MNNRRRFLGGAAALGVAALTGCEKAQQTMEGAGVLLNRRKGRKRFPDYRYRLTVTVDTPEGVKSGSSVIEVKTTIGGPNEIPSPGMLMTEISGEAVTVDLGKRGMLFALLRSETDLEWAHLALISLFPQRTTKELIALPEDVDPFTLDLEKALQLPLDKPLELPRKVDTTTVRNYKPVQRDNYPLLIRFIDPRDPLTIERVSPDDLAEAFGEGVTFESITLARTEATVTEEIIGKLPWLGKRMSTMLDGSRINDSDSLANNLSRADFINGGR